MKRPRRLRRFEQEIPVTEEPLTPERQAHAMRAAVMLLKLELVDRDPETAAFHRNMLGKDPLILHAVIAYTALCVQHLLVNAPPDAVDNVLDQILAVFMPKDPKDAE